MKGPGAAVVLALAATAACAAGKGMRDEGVKPPSSFEIPFKGTGQLATIWSWGRDRPDAPKALVITAHGKSRRLALEAPEDVRWQSPTELLVEQYVSPARDPSATRILRLSREGDVLKVLSDREGLSNPKPSPDGEWALVERYDQRGFRGIEVRNLAENFSLRTLHQVSVEEILRGQNSGIFGEAVWSPDGSKFVVGLWVTNPPMDPTHMSPHLAIADRDVAGFTRIKDVLPSGMPNPKRERWATVPLFWTEDGIYARSSRGLLRCDPDGSGCTLVYDPVGSRSVSAGTQTGNHTALLLVRDLSLDPFEMRSKEIHEVNLATGGGHVLLRLPASVFISDIAWVQDPGAP